MLQLSHGGVPPRAIARLLDCHPDTVRRWVARAATGAELDDRPRSGRPPVYAEAIQLKTIAFYCQVAPLPGCNTWSLRWAHRYLRTHRAILGAPMSRPTMQRILKRHALKPHLQPILPRHYRSRLLSQNGSHPRLVSLPSRVSVQF
jgi:transposase